MASLARRRSSRLGTHRRLTLRFAHTHVSRSQSKSTPAAVMSDGEEDEQQVAVSDAMRARPMLHFRGTIEAMFDAAKETEKGWEKFRRMQEEDKRRCDRLLSLERSKSPDHVHGDQS